MFLTTHAPQTLVTLRSATAKIYEGLIQPLGLREATFDDVCQAIKRTKYDLVIQGLMTTYALNVIMNHLDQLTFETLHQTTAPIPSGLDQDLSITVRTMVIASSNHCRRSRPLLTRLVA